MTALAGTIGIGSITGVATAIAIGGIGALFWMWVSAVMGMAVKYAEGILGIKYREIDKNNQMCGGPMYYLEKGLGSKKLGITFAIIGAFAAFGTGNVVQVNSIVSAFTSISSISSLSLGIIITIITGICLLGGIKSIGKISGLLVPVMGVFYIIGGMIIILLKIELVPEVIFKIFSSAFYSKAAVGGVVGSTIMVAIQTGVSRGIFSSEAGLGTGPITAAAAKTDVPARQALVSMSGVFITSFIICTITGLVIGVSGVIGEIGADGKILNGSALAVLAFKKSLPGGSIFLVISIVLFGFSTILGWAYCGEKCIEYLFGLKSVLFYRVIFISLIIPGAVLSLQTVWSFADVMNGLMTAPNLIGIFLLAKVVQKETKEFDLIYIKEKQFSYEKGAQ